MVRSDLPRIVDLSAVDLAVETLLSGLDGFTLMDRLEMDAAQAIARTRLGASTGEARGAVFYTLTESTNDLTSSRQRYYSEAESVLSVSLWVRVNPHAQRDGRRAALAAEAVLRQLLTDRSWSGTEGIRVSYVGTPARTMTQDAHRSDLVFRVHHPIRIGSAA